MKSLPCWQDSTMLLHLSLPISSTEIRKERVVSLASGGRYITFASPLFSWHRIFEQADDRITKMGHTWDCHSLIDCYDEVGRIGYRLGGAGRWVGKDDGWVLWAEH